MTVTNWNPWRELDTLRREVERVFENYGGEVSRGPFWRGAFLPGRAARNYPLLNLSDDKEHLYVEALAPGVNPETLDISVLQNTLRVSGEKQAISGEIKPEAFHRNERSAGSFVRTLTLPVDVDSARVTAEYKNGVLRITLPKAEAAKPKQITVQVK